MLYGKSGNLSNCFDIFGWNVEVGAVQKYVQLILYNWFSYIRQWSLPPPSFFRFFCIIVNTHFHYLIFNFGSFLPKDAYVKLVDLVKSCPHFHFFSLWYVFPPCPPLLKLWILFLNKILFPTSISTVYICLLFTWKNRRRYSRPRDSQSLKVWGMAYRPPAHQGVNRPSKYRSGHESADRQSWRETVEGRKGWTLCLFWLQA